MAPQITLPIVGVDFPNKRGPTRRFALELQRPGDPLELRPEPNNPADPNAIAVYSMQGVQIGYLPAERAPYVGLRLSRGHASAVFQGATVRGAFVRIAFDGEQPTLPPPSDEKSAFEDWYPDDVYPDD